jgi:hypothetical protein
MNNDQRHPQASFRDQMESMLTVAQELRSAESGAMAASLLAGEGAGAGEEEGAEGMATAAAMEE